MSGMISQQRANSDGLYLFLSDGREFTTSPNEIKALVDGFISAGSDLAAAKALAIVAIKENITAALSAECVDVAMIYFDFDTTTGIPSTIICASSVDALAQVQQ